MENKCLTIRFTYHFSASLQNDVKLCRYLGNADEIAKAAAAIAAQGKAK